MYQKIFQNITEILYSDRVREEKKRDLTLEVLVKKGEKWGGVFK